MIYINNCMSERQRDLQIGTKQEVMKKEIEKEEKGRGKTNSRRDRDRGPSKN